MKEDFSKIKRIRQMKKLLQSEVAEAAGISRSTYNLIENGEKDDILLRTAKGISKALEIPFNELFDIETNTVKQETDKLKVLVLSAIEKHEANQLFLKQFEHDQTNPEDWAKFEEFKKSISEYKKGLIETLVNVGFCTHEDIQEFHDWIHNKGKYKREKQ